MGAVAEEALPLPRQLQKRMLIRQQQEQLPDAARDLPTIHAFGGLIPCPGLVTRRLGRRNEFCGLLLGEASLFPCLADYFWCGLCKSIDKRLHGYWIKSADRMTASPAM